MVQGAGLTWPAGQFLPTFSTPAATIDCINMDTASNPEKALFVSLEGIVNRTQPQIACTSAASEGAFTWPVIHNLPYDTINGYSAILKYETNVTGLVVTDTNLPDTLNLATTIAGVKNELICDPSLLATLTNSPYNLTVNDDLRGKFTTKYQVYGYLYTNYWPLCTHRIIAGMETNQPWYLRDYLVAVKSAVVWLDPGVTADANVFKSFTTNMTPVGGVYLGWWPNESTDLNWIATYGIPVMASDLFDNGSVYGGVASPIAVPPIPPTPPLQNKIYVSMTLSDGDNVQYIQHTMKMNWGSAARGTVPIGWTVQPLLADFDPAMMNYFWSTATTNDCLVAGPSGAGYTHIEYWSSGNVTAYSQASNPYLQHTGIRTITVWDNVSGTTGDIYATNCPTLVGINDENNGYYVSHDGTLPVAGFPPTGSYATNTAELLYSITNTAASWNGSSPMFIAVQARSWTVTPANCQTVANSLDPTKYVVVRPDHLFLLYQKSAALGQGGAVPYVAAQPVSQLTNAGANVTFNIVASGTGPLNYQWRFNGTNIIDATNTTCIVSNAQASAIGFYQAIVTNLYGSATSTVCTLTLFGAGVITNTIYYDTFGRTGGLDGSTPVPVDTGNASWNAFSQLITVGAAIAVTNATPSGANYNNAFLPFTPQTGHIYTLSVTIYGKNGGTQWLAMGYAQNAIMTNYYAATNCGAGWLLQRANNSQIQVFDGPGTVGQNSYSAPGTAVTNSYRIVLDTTAGNAASGWNISFWANGTELRQDTYSTNPSIQYVGVGADGATGDYLDFELTDTPYQVPQPQLTAQKSGAQLTLVWPAIYQGWTLQSNSIGLQSPNSWATVSGSTATNQIFVNINQTKVNVFYRLIVP
jgi:hypothetical protein